MKCRWDGVTLRSLDRSNCWDIGAGASFQLFLGWGGGGKFF